MAQEQPKEQTSLANQLAELAIKVLKPGGVGVGGIYGLWLLFIEHKAAESIASALIGLCFSYLVKVLEPIPVVILVQGCRKRSRRIEVKQ